jgi:hypothetical protein
MASDHADSDTARSAADSASSSVAFVESKFVDCRPLVSAIDDKLGSAVLDSHGDGIQHIANWLDGRRGNEAVHAVSHGTPASVPC